MFIVHPLVRHISDDTPVIVFSGNYMTGAGAGAGAGAEIMDKDRAGELGCLLYTMKTSVTVSTH